MIRIRTALWLLAIILITPGCLKDVDFDQMDQLVYESSLDLALINYQLDQSDFLDENNQEKNFLEDETRLEIDNNIMRNISSDLVLHTEFENSFRRSFVCKYTFLDEQENTLASKEIYISDALEPDTSDISFTESELVAFKETRKIIVSITLLDGLPTVNAVVWKDLKVKSNISFHYAITF